MSRLLPLFSSSLSLGLARRHYSAQPLRYTKRNWPDIKRATRNPDLALSHFDGIYGKVYGKSWPSMRLGLLTAKKPAAVLNTFLDNSNLHDQLVEDKQAIDLRHYYKKHLISYTRWQLRQQLIENKRARKREIMAKSENIPLESIDPASIEVSDISDGELGDAQTTDGSDTRGFSTAEDLQAMFSDRRIDEDEKYFINKASTQLSLDDFVPATEYIVREDTVDEPDYLQALDDQDEPLDCEIREEPTFQFDDHLRVYTFPRNSWEVFDNPSSKEPERLLPYYLMDGASILPVLSLDLQLNDICADYCAAPGGKSLAMLMSLKPQHLLCNDISSSRLSRLTRIINQYVPEINYVKSTLQIARNDARKLVRPDTYDKILVDVPCSSDRESVSSLENNIFKRTRLEERLRIPSIQCDILVAALKSVKPKGAVVYSTCTMSPIENDSVVRWALTRLKESNFPATYAIMSLKEAFRPLRGLYRFKTNFKYGQQVVPSVCSNFGPMYISKIKRLT